MCIMVAKKTQGSACFIVSVSAIDNIFVFCE